MKRLIVNADDFGYSRKVNKAIIKCFKEGIVTSTSLIANAPLFDESLEILKKNRKLDVGIHLNLTEFAPLTKTKTLEKNGNFINKKKWYDGYFKIADKNEIESEVNEQFRKAISAGLEITHVDGHNHIHVFPEVIDIAAKLAKKYKIKWIRMPYEKNALIPYRIRPKNLLTKREILAKMKSYSLSAPNFHGGFFSESASEKELLNILKSLDEGINELMAHPAYIDRAGDDFHNLKQREQEIRLLTSRKTKRFIKENKIKLATFSASK